MIIRALDENHDWTFGKGKGNYNRFEKAVAENLQTRLLSFLGDCFFDLSAGIDWFNLMGSNQRLRLKLDISSVILNTPDVTGIVGDVEFYVLDDRLVYFTASLNTIYGRTGLNVNLSEILGG